MHERTSRAVARLLFVLFCAAPTLATVSLILVTWTDWYHHRALRALERSLSRETGLVVKLDDFERISPSGIRLRGLRLIEPEISREVVRVRVAVWVSDGERTAIQLSQPELHSAGLPDAWQLIHDRYLRRPEWTRQTTRLSATDLTIHSRSGPLTLRDVRAQMKPLETGVEASVVCHPADAGDNAEPLRIQVVRDRGGKTPATRWSMRSATTPLPCSALGEFLPIFESLGHRATFSGSLVWQVDRRGWSIDLGGASFEQVELGRLSMSMPQRLTGTARLDLERCRWKPGEYVDISGRLTATRGYVGKPLLHAMRDHFGFAVPQSDDSSTDLGYDQLAIHFDLNGAQMRLTGACGGLPDYRHLGGNVVMCVGMSPLVFSQPDWLPSSRALQVLAPPHSAMVPIARQTSDLLGLFLSPSHPMPNDSPSPAARITSVRNAQGDDPIRQR